MDRSDYKKKRHDDFKDWAIEYLGGECLGCGLKYYPWQYDIHHIDPREKKFEFNQMRYKSWEEIEAELDKSILLCKNCHADIHHNPLCKKVFGYNNNLYTPPEER